MGKMNFEYKLFEIAVFETEFDFTEVCDIVKENKEKFRLPSNQEIINGNPGYWNLQLFLSQYIDIHTKRRLILIKHKENKNES